MGRYKRGTSGELDYNEELNTFIKGKYIVEFVKAQRIRWLGHV
jgi:hypothetical protein